MNGSKLVVVGLVVLAAMSTVRADDVLGLGLTGGSGGGLGGGLTGGVANALGGLAGMGELLGGNKENQNSLFGLGKDKDKSESKGSTDIAKKETEGFLGIKGPGELIKLLLNPFELCAKIAEHFKLSFDKFFPLVSKGINFGLEFAVQPVILSLKIIEKVFVPDNCKLKFVCGLTRTLSFTKDIVPKLSDKTLSESKVFKALCDGIHGDCESIYQCDGNPKIKDEFKNHQKGNKHDEQKHDQQKNDQQKNDEQKPEIQNEGQQEEQNFSASNVLKSKLKSKN